MRAYSSAGSDYWNQKPLSACFVALLLILTGLSPGHSQAGPQGRNALDRDTRWAILVTGTSGDPDLQKQYLKELVELRSVLEDSLGYPRDRVVALFDDPALDPAHIQYQSTRENLARVCRDVAGRAGKDDSVFIFLEGHGSADGSTYKLNLVGPDPTGEDLASMFYSIPAQRFLVVNATNCSGASLEALAGKGRIVIAATRSGSEKNLTHLGKYLIDAFAANHADVDKNGRVSVYEAFAYAAHQVEEYYTKEGSMQTEHPMLNDNGDAQAVTPAEAAAAGSAMFSRAAYLDRGSPLLTQGDMSPESQALAREAQSLEKQIELLKSSKDEMSEAEYEKRLEELLLKLAEVQTKLRKKVT